MMAMGQVRQPLVGGVIRYITKTYFNNFKQVCQIVAEILTYLNIANM